MSSIFNLHNKEQVGKKLSIVLAEVDFYKIANAMDYKLLEDVVKLLAEKITKALYDDVLKSIDKDTIVREVSLRVSDNILGKIFKKERE